MTALPAAHNIALLILGCMTQGTVYAAEPDYLNTPAEVKTGVVDRYLVRAASADVAAPARTERLAIGVAQPGMRKSPFTLAIEQAAKKGIVEQAVAGYTEVLIQCQKDRSTVLTTPFMRSDGQQAHCYRF